MTIDKQGRIEVGYADGCIAACVTDATHNSDDGPADAQAAYATIARQDTGQTLCAAQCAAAVSPSTNVKVTKLRVRHGTGLHYTAKVKIKNTGTTSLSKVRVYVMDNRHRIGKVKVRWWPLQDARIF